MIRLLVVATALLALSLQARAGAETATNCEDMNSTYEMNVCADKAYAAADAKLNRAYQAAMAAIDERGGDKPYDAKSWKNALRNAQRAWIAYRDADCKEAVPMEWGGGTGTTSAVLGCLTEKTETRTRELQERFSSDTGAP